MDTTLVTVLFDKHAPSPHHVPTPLQTPAHSGLQHTEALPHGADVFVGKHQRDSKSTWEQSAGRALGAGLRRHGREGLAEEVRVGALERGYETEQHFLRNDREPRGHAGRSERPPGGKAR